MCFIQIRSISIVMIIQVRRTVADLPQLHLNYIYEKLCPFFKRNRETRPVFRPVV